MDEPRQVAGFGPRLPAAARRAVAAAALFVVLATVLYGVFAAMPVLYDTDSYCHLGLGLYYQQKGISGDLDPARFSAMGDGFGDKEFLFHLLLSLFARPGDSSGGRLALALLDAAILTLVSLLAVEAIGRWGWLTGPALLLLAQDVPDRLLRLRPELVGILLFLLATAAAARGRYRTLGLLALLLALTYNVVQILVALVLGWALVRWWRGSRFDWAGVLYPLLGIGLGLVLHPHFPKNLEIWLLITFEHLGRIRDFPEGGRELLPGSSAQIFRDNLAWWIAFACLWLALDRSGAARAPDGRPPRPESGCYTVSAVGFALLYVGVMWRFGVYFYLFATLALFHEAKQRGWRIGRFVPAAGRLRLPVWTALGLAFAIAVAPARAMAAYFLDERAPGPPREAEWRAFGAAVPSGAKVAAPWGETGAYLFWAPGGRYLNILDPFFMAAAFPAQYGVQRALFAGELPDVPLALVGALDSDYLAFSRFLAPARLQARCAADPRLELVYAGYNLLYRVRRDRNDEFWLDWTYSMPTPRQVGIEPTAVRYPRTVGSAATVEGFVDASRVGASRACVRFERRFELAAPESWRVELAPYGPARLAIDGVPRLDLRAPTAAVLGQGAVVELELAPGSHAATVESCPAAGGQNGFYFRRLPPA